MYTKDMFSRPLRAKSGMATVLGMLIFVGILFTCVIPLFLYINKVNSYYDRAATEIRQFDQDREGEWIDVYAYPSGDPPDKLNIYIKNLRPLSVKIVRVWINDDKFNFSFQIRAMETRTMEPIEVGLTETKAFYIKVMTARGNAFSSFTNPLYYVADGGGWSGGTSFTIQIVIETLPPLRQRVFHVTVADDMDPANVEFFYEAYVVKRALETTCFTAVTVPLDGDYYVTIEAVETGGAIITNKLVTVTTTERSQFLHVPAG